MQCENTGASELHFTVAAKLPGLRMEARLLVIQCFQMVQSNLDYLDSLGLEK